MCQVCDGELKGRDIKRLISASVVGTEHKENKFTVEWVWKMVRKEYPDASQTTYDNLNHWFDEVKVDSLKTGLVDSKRELISEVILEPDTMRRTVNMDKAHHDFLITGDKGSSCAVLYQNDSFQRRASRGCEVCKARFRCLGNECCWRGPASVLCR